MELYLFLPNASGSTNVQLRRKGEVVVSDEKFVKGSRVSRRGFLNIAAAGGGAVVAVGVGSAPAAASNKMSQSAVKYQPTPKGNQRCDNCMFWEPPSHCKLVVDPIAPSGWCVLYRSKG